MPACLAAIEFLIQTGCCRLSVVIVHCPLVQCVCLHVAVVVVVVDANNNVVPIADEEITSNSQFLLKSHVLSFVKRVFVATIFKCCICFLC